MTWRTPSRRDPRWPESCIGDGVIVGAFAPWLKEASMRTCTLFALPLLLTGCFGPPSHVDSSASITVGGDVARADGGAYASAKVLLIRHPDALQAIGDVITVIGSVGLACVVGNDSLCSPYAKATVGSDGKYA